MIKTRNVSDLKAGFTDTLSSGALSPRDHGVPIGRRLRVHYAIAFLIACLGTGATCEKLHAESLRDAVDRTVRTNPGVAAAQANRRAIGFELRQAQGRLLPELNLDADAGGQWVNRPNSLAVDDNEILQLRRQATLTARQILFDAWDRSNGIYRSAARLDAAAHRVMEQSELRALDAIEAYIDVRRNQKILGIAERNVRRHRIILRLVDERRRGGKAPDSEVTQARERVAAAQAIAAQIKQSLLEAVAKYRRVTGRKPDNLQPVGFPTGIPGSTPRAIEIGVLGHPSMLAADRDIDEAKFAVDQSLSGNMPVVSLEGSATYGRDVNGTTGRSDDLSAKVVLGWRLFDGRIADNRTNELRARLAQAQAVKEERRRAIVEAIERAIAGFRVGGTRVALLRKRAAQSRRVITAYNEEYKLSKRSLLDLLDAENGLFTSQFQLESVRAVHVFSSYQLLGSIGRLLEVLGIEPPPEVTADHLVQIEESRWGVLDIEIEPLRQ